MLAANQKKLTTARNNELERPIEPPSGPPQSGWVQPPKDRKGLRRGEGVGLFECVIAPNILSIRC
jgi:hypothetical protein